MGLCLMEGLIVLCWAAKAELASLFSSCDFSSEFVSPMFVLVDLTLTLNLSSGGDKSVLFCSLTAEWEIKDCEQCSKPAVAESALLLVFLCGGLNSDLSGSLKRLFLTST